MSEFANSHAHAEFGSVYPFAAIVDQELMKKALILNAIDPKIGGVLIKGDKGTAKSTAVRALAALLPEIDVIDGCEYGCDPADHASKCRQCAEGVGPTGRATVSRRRVRLVNLPLNATEDKVIGSIDLERAIKEGVKRFEPGLLALAHRGVIYIDEVNLLNDHIVDVLLDVASTGVNRVERETISFAHPAEIVLVGSMNPEEGELRPQLLDRFGLCVQVEGLSDPADRVELIRRREAHDVQPASFAERWERDQTALRERIVGARQRAVRVLMTDESVKLIAAICLENSVSGHRADVVIERTARAIAAWEGRTRVATDDILLAAELALPHRRRASVPSEPPPPQQQHEHEHQHDDEDQQHERDEEMNSDTDSREQTPARSGQDRPDQSETEQSPDPQDSQGETGPSGSSMRDEVFSVGEPYRVRRIAPKEKKTLRRGSGRRSRAKTASKSGRYVKAVQRRDSRDVAIDSTLRAAAPYQLGRRAKALERELAVVVEAADIRDKVREKRVGNLLIFIVDASGSMGAQRRMIETKAAILSLLIDAYQKRDRVGMVVFRGDSAELLLPPTNSVELARKKLEEMPVGGKTPLSCGLARAYEVAKAHLRKDPDTPPLLILITDGRANVSMSDIRPLEEARKVAIAIEEEERIKTLVIDTEKDGLIRLGMAAEIARVLGGQYAKVEELRAEGIVGAVMSAL
ncbi:MAG: putative cobaltochelatase [Coriobacteriia bacterium]|nr:putative cobaltochelatase [Coriobacteriia bacterium]